VRQDAPKWGSPRKNRQLRTLFCARLLELPPELLEVLANLHAELLEPLGDVCPDPIERLSQLIARGLTDGRRRCRV